MFASDLGFQKGQDFELEDVLSGEFYHTAVKETYPQYPVEQPDSKTAKRTVSYETAFRTAYGIGFSKRRVGETAKKLLLDGKADSTTSKKLELLTSKLWEALARQVKKPVKSASRETEA